MRGDELSTSGIMLNLDHSVGGGLGKSVESALVALHDGVSGIVGQLNASRWGGSVPWNLDV